MVRSTAPVVLGSHVVGATPLFSVSAEVSRLVVTPEIRSQHPERPQFDFPGQLPRQYSEPGARGIACAEALKAQVFT
jgi:hypothetical protein